MNQPLKQDLIILIFLMREKAREKKKIKRKKKFSLQYAYVITCVDNHVTIFAFA